MHRKLGIPGFVLMSMLAFSLMWQGCTRSGLAAHPVATAADQAHLRPSGDGAPASTNGVKADSASDDEEAERAKDARKLAKLERDVAIACESVARAQMACGHSELEHAGQLANAELELDLARQRLQNFTERVAPNRIEWARLGLVRAEDRVKEAAEELRQLEMMYAEDDFADGTKEIVLERGRRRLERARRDLELRREDLDILTTKTLPLEQDEHEQRVAQKTRSLEKAHRSAEAAHLDKQIALLKAESRVAQLEADIDAHHEEMERKRKKREDKKADAGKDEPSATED
jgi:hypothetical protein